MQTFTRFPNMLLFWYETIVSACIQETLFIDLVAAQKKCNHASPKYNQIKHCSPLQSVSMTRLRSCSVVPLHSTGRRFPFCKEKHASEHELAQSLHCYVRPLQQIPSRLKMLVTRIQTQRHPTAPKQGVILQV